MILQMEAKTLGESLHLLIGLLIIRVFGSLLVLGIWVSLRVFAGAALSYHLGSRSAKGE